MKKKAKKRGKAGKKAAVKDLSAKKAGSVKGGLMSTGFSAKHAQ